MKGKEWSSRKGVTRGQLPCSLKILVRERGRNHLLYKRGNRADRWRKMAYPRGGDIKKGRGRGVLKKMSEFEQRVAQQM